MSEQLKEAVRESVREGLGGEQVLTEGMVDKVKSFFGKNDEVKTIFMRGGDRVAVFSYSEGTNDYAYTVVDNRQNKEEESGQLNGKSELKEKQKELKERGFDVVTDGSTAKRIASTIMKISGVFGIASGIIGIAMGGFVLATGAGAAALGAATGTSASIGAAGNAANLAGIQIVFSLSSAAGGVWTVKRANERKDKLKRDKATRQQT